MTNEDITARGAVDAASSGLALRDIYVAVSDGDHSRIILDHLDMVAVPGEVLVLTGGSGSGKSTLLAIAGLLRRPGGGHVFIDGIAATELSERRRTALRKERIGLVYQSANLIPALTSMEQLELVGHINGAKRADSRRRAARLLADVGLTSRANALPAQMSGGERQRVGIARALMAEPTVLLGDEPTASLDPELAAEVTALIADQTHARGLATVLVTHDDAPLRRADRHFHLAGGKLHARELVGD
ncbi:MAG: ATP-binding cassette domain-containing protein [Ilumatobacteraceae bacterium]